MKQKYLYLIDICLVFILCLSSCTHTEIITPVPTEAVSTVIASATPTETKQVTSTIKTSPTSTATLILPDFYEPAGCRPPTDDYTLYNTEGWVLNQRTLEMLNHADKLYDGEIDITGHAITQGSFSYNSSGSFGTHTGGGAIDFTVMRRGTYQILYNEIEPLLKALRTAGFAAWYRDLNELYDGSPVHIHAIAIGDAQLSEQAKLQLNGLYGYFQGFNGLPEEYGDPQIDTYGSPVLCEWMRNLGYESEKGSTINSYPKIDWRTKLKQTGEESITHSAQETILLAGKLDFRKEDEGYPDKISALLGIDILQRAGLLPMSLQLHLNIWRTWLANPDEMEIDWSLFPERDYQLHQFSVPAERFNFSAWPLYTGDIMLTRAGEYGHNHFFIITEIDEEGRIFTVTNNVQSDQTYLIEKLMLWDPDNPTAGALKQDWVNCYSYGCTGNGGFDVLRPKGIGLPTGSLFKYFVQPGDTLPAIANKFFTTIPEIIYANNLMQFDHLLVGQELKIPVNTLFTP
ncbi:MAG: LysM peptidoglycan-binding domain-containing protein [Anaerolineaceae bacterium]|nr:LysM peptidoglycan-binding domain-containing protein [Anaerolineaceae bacterium]